MTTCPFTSVLLATVAASLPSVSCAGEVRNLNEVCQDYILTESENRKAELRDAAAEKNVLYQFRYLQVTRIGTNMPVKGAITLMTMEPGSKMHVQLTLTQSKSLAIAKEIKIGEAVAGKGRIKAFDHRKSGTIVMNPAVLKHKDRLAPTREKELLNEVDAQAY
ncbi:MAG: hypothetical protein O2901_16945 [Verrucomicrobia bacterium]|nr:hypothetical protein [Verrucomicrobiota bacterium]